MKKQIYTIKQGEDLAKDYCSLQERSHKEVFLKLREWGLGAEESDQVISILITQNYINEERYAKLFAKSKFNQNKWGKIKIRYTLRQKDISEKCIAIGLKEIDDYAYRELCEDIAIKKLNSLKGNSSISNKQKIVSFLYSKGFEYELINDVLNKIIR